MSDDQNRPGDPAAPPTPPPTAPAYGGTVTYDPPPGYAGQSGDPWPQRPRFVDQVLGMRAVVAVALACLIIGGLSGFVLCRATGGHDRGFGPGGVTFQRGVFPHGPKGFSNQPNGVPNP